MSAAGHLDGEWSLFFGADDGSIIQDRHQAIASGYRQITARVPGNVEIDLVAAGIEEDPFFADHILRYEKYEYYNWLFERSFRPDSAQKEKCVYLKFGGINTFATVFLNGVCLGETANMLIEHAFDVTDILNWDQDNTLAVFIRSAMNQARKQEYPAAVRGGEHSDEMTRLRMPPHSFGWDIMPRLLSAGLWRPVTLEYKGKERLDDLYLYTQAIEKNQAVLCLAYTFVSDHICLPKYQIKIEGRCGEHYFCSVQTTHFISNHLSFSVDKPRLWWPRGYGDQPLYDVTVSLIRDGKTVDQRSFPFGIRKATVDACFNLDQKQKFQVMVNDKPIFIRGSNWVPLSALHSLDESRVDQAIELAYECGCNALRCWGGNVYETRRFYDLCDQRGILVWQDFTMACATQNSDDEFVSIIRQEATAVVKSLRNHACLLLWAGDNEVDQVYQLYPRGFARYNRITREVLPSVIGAHDPMRFYLPSSPFMPDSYDHDQQGPEQHLWGPRDDFKGDFYRLNRAVFASEIGYHGCPSIQTLKQFIAADQLWPYTGSLQWLIHNSERPIYRRGYDRNELMAKQVAILFGSAPENLDDFVFASQVSQAEAKKFFIEQFRMQKGQKTGLIWWNIIDGWPQISDAVVDYMFVKKLAYHIITRSQRDVQLMIGEYEAWKHQLAAVNDTLKPVSGKWLISKGLARKLVCQGSYTLEADQRAVLAEFAANPSEQDLYLIEWQSDGKTYYNHYIAGRYPFKLSDLKAWMKLVSSLEPQFSLETDRR